MASNPINAVGGGTFVFCLYNGETLAYKMDTGDSFDKLLHRIQNQWKKLHRDDFTMHYSTPDYSGCVLATDDDFSTMVAVAVLYNLDRLTINISKKGCAAVCNHSSSSSYTDNSALTNVDTTSVDQDFLPLYCPSNKKRLLTAGWDKEIMGVGQQFEGGAAEFRIAMRKMAIGVGFDFNWGKNDSARVSATCSKKESSGCGWYVYASKDPTNGYFYVKTLNNVHTCGSCFRSLKHNRVCADLVCSLIVDQVRKKSETRPIDVVKMFMHEYGLEISYTIAFDAVEKAKRCIHGDDKESFEMLSRHVKAIKDSNPGSHVVLDVTASTCKFRRIFISLKGCIDGFNFCRPLLFLDGTYLRGKFKGHLLAATSKDGDRGLYPLAFAVVDSENAANWKWFLKNLREIIPPTRMVTFVSDRNPGLLDAMSKIFPDFPHGYCLNHLKNNLKDKFSGRRASKSLRSRMVWLLMNCAYAPTVQGYQQNMTDLLKEGGCTTQSFFENMNPCNWANAFFTGQRYGEMSSNAAESFNNWILEARHLPITALVNSIRVKMMKSFFDRRAGCQNWTNVFCPSVEKKLTALIDEGRTWIVVGSYASVYEVQCVPSVVVNLLDKTCSCRQWQITGLPCSHAIACIMTEGRPMQLYVDGFYHSFSYIKSYSAPLHPVSMFDQPEAPPDSALIIPPETRRPPGRPKRKRILSRGEHIPRPIQCGRCGKVGNHNKKSCTEPLA